MATIFYCNTKHNWVKNGWLNCNQQVLRQSSMTVPHIDEAADLMELHLGQKCACTVYTLATLNNMWHIRDKISLMQLMSHIVDLVQSITFPSPNIVFAVLINLIWKIYFQSTTCLFCCPSSCSSNFLMHNDGSFPGLWDTLTTQNDVG